MDERSGQGDLEGIADARARIGVAFEAIAASVEALMMHNLREPAGADPAEVEALRVQVEEERAANAHLTERVRAQRERQDGRVAELERELAHARERISSLEAAHAANRSELDAVLAELVPILEEEA